LLLTEGRTCRSVVKDAKIIFAVVTSAIVGTNSGVPDHDHRVVTALAALLATDLDDSSHETLTTVLILPLPVIAPYDPQSNLYSSEHCAVESESRDEKLQ